MLFPTATELAPWRARGVRFKDSDDEAHATLFFRFKDIISYNGAKVEVFFFMRGRGGSGGRRRID
jgi:hypothetical protein